MDFSAHLRKDHDAPAALLQELLMRMPEWASTEFNALISYILKVKSLKLRPDCSARQIGHLMPRKIKQ